MDEVVPDSKREEKYRKPTGPKSAGSAFPFHKNPKAPMTESKL
jgi:hypothetical protein